MYNVRDSFSVVQELFILFHSSLIYLVKYHDLTYQRLLINQGKYLLVLHSCPYMLFFDPLVLRRLVPWNELF